MQQISHVINDNNVNTHFSYSDTTPITLAILMKKNYAFDYFLSIGADIDHKNAKSQTPLMIALIEGNAYAATKLIELGADINANDINQNTALKIATENKNQEIIELLNNKLTKNQTKTRCAPSP